MQLFTIARRRRPAGGAVAVLVAAASVAALGLTAPQAGATDSAALTGPNWVGTWGATPIQPLGPDNTLGTPASFTNQTLRMVVQPHLGGQKARIRLSNRYGTVPVTFGDIRIGRQVPGANELAPGLGLPLLPTSADNFPGQLVGPETLVGGLAGAAVVPGSNVPLTFGGNASVTLAPGERAYSDPVAISVQAFQNLVVSFYLPNFTGPATQHTVGTQTNYTAPGDQSDNTTPVGFATNGISYYFLSDVDVVGGLTARSVITLGDSITDGLNSTINANHRYPDYLARRLQASLNHKDVSVVNQGVSGQRVLYRNIGPSAIRSLDLNVLSQPGVKYIILEDGINDLANPPFIGTPLRHPERITAQQVIDGLTLIINRAHAAGVKVFATTITPSGNLLNPARGLFETYSLPEVVAKRHAVNKWIRTSGVADAVIDFDAAIRDPLNPDSLNPIYASIDNLHPNDAGYQLLARTVPLSLFN